MSMALPQPVPRTAIALYADMLGVQPDERFEFVEIVAAIDDCHVAVEVERMNAEVKAQAAKRKNR